MKRDRGRQLGGKVVGLVASIKHASVCFVVLHIQYHAISDSKFQIRLLKLSN